MPRVVYEIKVTTDTLDDGGIPYEYEARVVLRPDTLPAMSLAPYLVVESKERDAMGNRYWSPVKAAAQRSKILEAALLSKEGIDVNKLVKKFGFQ